MTALVHPARDVVGDRFHRISELYTPPDFVKTASATQLAGDESLAEAAFADPTQRLYPCHTAAATWRSMGLFLEHRDSHSKAAGEIIAGRIRKAAVYFGVAQHLDELQTKMAAASAMQDSTLADDVYALVWSDEDGEINRNYPLRNAGEVKVAAEWFGSYRDEFTYADRRTMASKILDKAAAYGADLSAEQQILLTKCAGQGLCPAGNIADALTTRALLATSKHPQLARQLQKLAEDVHTNPAAALKQEFRDKLAGVMDQFDRETKLCRLYDSGLDRPEDVLFEVPTKAAAEFCEGHVATINGNIYSKTALAAVQLPVIREWLGDDFADAVSTGGLYSDVDKLAAIVPTLPRGDADLFERMVESAGVQPVVRDKSAEVVLPLETLAKLASDYQPA